MLDYLTLILVCQLAGELLVTASGLPLPGPVVGMVLLFAFLMVRGSVPDELAKVGEGLLGYLSLLFVPAGVGVMAHFALLETDWLPLSAAVIVSTVLTIMVTAGVMAGIGRMLPVAGGVTESNAAVNAARHEQNAATDVAQQEIDINKENGDHTRSALQADGRGTREDKHDG